MNITYIAYAICVLGGIGVVFGVILTFADRFFAVSVDPRIASIQAELPGANCGACGYPGCDAFAEAVAKGEAKVGGCVPGGARVSAAIADLMEKSDAPDHKPRIARVMCQGAAGISKQRYQYDGYQSCQMASGMVGGPKLCRYACVGLGDCVAVCAFGALSVEGGLARIDEGKCTACGMCEKTCPRGSIQLLPVDNNILVRCQNQDAARDARQVCMKACIGCSRCEKECKVDAIHVRDGFAHIDLGKCTRCGDCANVCPVGCIVIG